MSIKSALTVFVGLMVASQTAYAQNSDSDSDSDSDSEGRLDRFFGNKVSDDGPTPTTTVQGTLTSSTFVQQEFGGTGNDDNAQQNTRIDDTSAATRLFTDLRAQLTARDIAGSPLQARLDARVRVNLPCEFLSPANTMQQENLDNLPEYNACRTQSGTFGENEYELRELYGTYTGDSLNIQLGRQFVPEVAALKVDGVGFRYTVNKEWSLVAMGGLHPSKISRSVLEDYPVVPVTDGDSQSNTLALPVAAGAGGAYSYEKYFGSVAAAGILPSITSTGSGDDAQEPVRTFVTSNGYWRPLETLDVYHFAVVDITGATGTGITNASLGINFKPSHDLRITGAYNQVDTETLNITARNRLEDVGDGDTMLNVIDNNLEVARTSSRSARLGVSAALAERRFELSTQVQARFRPQISLCLASDADCANPVTFPGAQSMEVMISGVDRRSFADMRLGASLIATFGLGSLLDSGDGDTQPDNNARRSQSFIALFNGTRSFDNERIQLDANLSLQYTQDIGGERMDGEQTCNSGTPLSCFGNATIYAAAGGGTVYYRVLPDVFLVGNLNGGLYLFTDTNDANNPEPAINTLVSLFLRAAYRF